MFFLSLNFLIIYIKRLLDMFKFMHNTDIFRPILSRPEKSFKEIKGFIKLVDYVHEPVGVPSDFDIQNLQSASVPLKDSNFSSPSTLTDFDNVNKVAQKILSDDDIKTSKNS